MADSVLVYFDIWLALLNKNNIIDAAKVAANSKLDAKSELLDVLKNFKSEHVHK